MEVGPFLLEFNFIDGAIGRHGGEVLFGDPFVISEGLVGGTVESARSFNLQMRFRKSGSEELL